jgi:hypothetical protein
LSAVRWVVLVTTLLASVEVAAAKTMADRPADVRHARCERCGQTGPTIPVTPVVFRGDSAAVFAVRDKVEQAGPDRAARRVRANSTIPVRDEFAPGSPKPIVGAAVTR